MSVIDSGIGMNTQEQSRLTDNLVNSGCLRVNENSTGIGLGLVLAQNIALMLGSN